MLAKKSLAASKKRKTAMEWHHEHFEYMRQMSSRWQRLKAYAPRAASALSGHVQQRNRGAKSTRWRRIAGGFTAAWPTCRSAKLCRFKPRESVCEAVIPSSGGSRHFYSAEFRSEREAIKIWRREIEETGVYEYSICDLIYEHSMRIAI